MKQSSLKIAHKVVNESTNSQEKLKKYLDELLLKDIDGVEFDIRQTKDGHFIASHNKKISGMPSFIRDNTLDELRRAAKNATMTLHKVLEIIPEKLLINIEVKDCSVDAQKFLRALQPFRRFNQIIVSSFYPEVLLQLADSGIQRRWLLTSISYRRNPIHLLYALSPIKTARACKATGIAPFYRLVTSRLVKKAHENNLTVTCWTVNERGNPENFRECGVDYVIRDIPNT